MSECHTHGLRGEAGIAEIVDLCGAICSDELVIIEELGGTVDGHARWIDLREADALLEERTSPFSAGTVRLKSWTGGEERVVGVNDL